MLIGTEGDNLNITRTGTGEILNSVPNRFTEDIIKDTNTTSGDGRTIMGQNTFTAINTDGTRSVMSNTGVQLQDTSGNALALQQVSGNAPQGSLNNQGYLSSIKVDDNWFNLPTLSSGVAEALPGLSETLAGPPTNITTGRFFYGTQNAAGALFQAATTPASLTTAEAITAAATSITVAAGNQTDFASIFAGVPTGQNLYFVDSTYTTAFPAAGGQIVDTAVNIYLVVAL